MLYQNMGDSRFGRLAMCRIPTLAEVERRHVLKTLHLCGNNRTHAAKVLGLSIRGLRIKLHQYERDGMVVPAPKRALGKRSAANSEAA
jgi:DNA-binding NtrC family response regulator